MKVRTAGAEVGRIVTVRVDGAEPDAQISLGDYVVTGHGRIYEVVRVHRVKSGKSAGRYELRGRVASETPSGVRVHKLEWRRSDRHLTMGHAPG